MFAATGYELLSLLKRGAIGDEDWTALAIAFVASTITAFIAVKWLLRYIQGHRFTAFAVYRPRARRGSAAVVAGGGLKFHPARTPRAFASNTPWRLPR